MKACYGTTKYCNAFLKGIPCNNSDCLYLHAEGEPRSAARGSQAEPPMPAGRTPLQPQIVCMFRGKTYTLR